MNDDTVEMGTNSSRPYRLFQAQAQGVFCQFPLHVLNKKLINEKLRIHASIISSLCTTEKSRIYPSASLSAWLGGVV